MENLPFSVEKSVEKSLAVHSYLWKTLWNSCGSVWKTQGFLWIKIYSIFVPVEKSGSYPQVFHRKVIAESIVKLGKMTSYPHFPQPLLLLLSLNLNKIRISIRSENFDKKATFKKFPDKQQKPSQ